MVVELLEQKQLAQTRSVLFVPQLLGVALLGQPCEPIHKDQCKLVPYWPLALVHSLKCFLARPRPLMHQQTLP